jgi:predicted metal-dependent phosphoesterase TrpH
MDIDLHTHTFPASTCSHMARHEFVAACTQRELRAIALTNHGDMSDNRALERPLAGVGITLIHGCEVSTPLGDFVIFSPDIDYLDRFRDVQDIPAPHEIADHAAVVWVHPASGGGRSGSTYHAGLERLVAPLVAAVEVYNGNWLAAPYVDQAQAIVNQLGAAATGGSDAHQVEAIMTCYTRFPDWVTDTADVVRALKSGMTQACGTPVAPEKRTARRRFGLLR